MDIIKLTELVCRCGEKTEWEKEFNDLLGEWYLFCPKCGRILGALIDDETVELIPELNWRR